MNRVRNKNKADQRRYAKAVEYDEYLLATTGQFAPKTCIHEIVYGSGRTFEEWNMIALSNAAPFYHHDRAHSIRRPEITKRELFLAKIKLGYPLPPIEVQRKYGLGAFA